MSDQNPFRSYLITLYRYVSFRQDHESIRKLVGQISTEWFIFKKTLIKIIFSLINLTISLSNVHTYKQPQSTKEESVPNSCIDFEN